MSDQPPDPNFDPPLPPPPMPPQNPYAGAVPMPSYPVPGYSVPKPTSTKAVIALCLAVASFIFACGPITSIPAIIVGRLAVKEIDESNGTIDGRPMATAAWIVGVVNLVLVVAAIVLVVVIYQALPCKPTGNVPSYNCR